MNNDIILAGVGGQGILSIAAAIGLAAVNSNLHIKQSEVHGMSQRGGDVQSHLPDLIPAGKAHLIISVEPMEGLRYMPFLSKNGWLVTNITPFDNIPDYPKVDEILKRVKAVKNHIALDADSIAKECGSTKASNIVMLGAASPFIDIPAAGIEEGIRQLFNRKGEDIVNLNLKAFRAGREYSEKNR